jgi:hypothetical protein
MSSKKCTHKKPDGEQCKANAQAGAPLCFFHDPKKKLELKAARVQGGKTHTMSRVRVLPFETADIDVGSEFDVVRLIKETINHVRTGKISVPVASVIGNLCGVALKALNQDDTDRRIRKLEDDMRPMKGLTAEQLIEIANSGKPVKTDAATPSEERSAH